MKIYTVALLGCGTRAESFASTAVSLKDKYKIVALCDKNTEQLKKIHDRFGLNDTLDFSDDAIFLQKKLADVVYISTDDRCHVPQAVRALELGYDILLEKPITDDRNELKQLCKAQELYGGRIIVCHELRYGFGYRKCAELLNSGIIGDLYTIDHSERVAYWHWAQAYVRGIGASIKHGHPAILAKCSHDLDLIQAYAKSRCKTVSSVGDLRFFRPKNAPKDAAERCLDCVHVDTCPYSAKRIYIDNWHKNGEPEFVWPYSKVSLTVPNTEESLKQGLAENNYGICVFKCHSEKVDHQLVQMNFENGIKASLKMVYSAFPGRCIIFYGTHGEITFDERENTIEIWRYGEEKEIIDTNMDCRGHGGGDPVLIKEMYDYLESNTGCATTLADSVECHLMGITAEESRKLNGKLLNVHDTEL